MRVRAVALQQAISAEPYQSWGADSEPSAQFYELGGGFLVRFPRIADFHLSADGQEVVCTPAPDGQDVFEGLYAQQVEPLQMSLRGQPVFHGGAVVDDGDALVFLGPSGRGKSTLTTAFASRGIAFLSDDCVRLSTEHDGGTVLVHAHASTIRLWQDSVDGIAPQPTAAVQTRGSPKPRINAGSDLPHCTHAMPLGRVYVLGDALVEEPVIRLMTPLETITAWTSNAFVLDIKSAVTLKRNLALASRLSVTVPARRLDYPRRYERLNDVVDLILADAAAQ